MMEWLGDRRPQRRGSETSESGPTSVGGREGLAALLYPGQGHSPHGPAVHGDPGAFTLGLGVREGFPEGTMGGLGQGTQGFLEQRWKVRGVS